MAVSIAAAAPPGAESKVAAPATADVARTSRRVGVDNFSDMTALLM